MTLPAFQLSLSPSSAGKGASASLVTRVPSELNPCWASVFSLETRTRRALVTLVTVRDKPINLIKGGRDGGRSEEGVEEVVLEILTLP